MAYNLKKKQKKNTKRGANGVPQAIGGSLLRDFSPSSLDFFSCGKSSEQRTVEFPLVIEQQHISFSLDRLHRVTLVIYIYPLVI